MLFQFYAKNDGLRLTDLHQGIVWGTNTPQTVRDERLVNRFDYDSDYGTVLNRYDRRVWWGGVGWLGWCLMCAVALVFVGGISRHYLIVEVDTAFFIVVGPSCLTKGCCAAVVVCRNRARNTRIHISMNRTS